MKTQMFIKSMFLMVVMSTAMIPSVNAQGCCGGSGGSSCHADKSMYGGTVKQVGKHKIEMVYEPMLKQDPLLFYLMNKKGKPISNAGITGKAEITYADSSTGTITLEPRAENAFAGQMTNKRGSFICLLTLNINGENVTVQFEAVPAGKESMTSKATYTCPMHPEVQSDNPGSCPKCGMALKKANN